MHQANQLSDRLPVVAGRFYPSSDTELRKELERLFEQAKKHELPEIKQGEEILALVSPHAGYVFSGTVAASAFLPLKNGKNIKTVFLIGSSHNAWYEKASIYYSGHYITPLGKVKVDRTIANALLAEKDLFAYLPEAHAHEHCLEVQLPFLQYSIKNGFTIVPILLGGQSKEVSKQVAKALKPYFVPGNLFVISTDLSHYPSYNDAVKVDKQTIYDLCSNNPESFLQRLKNNDLLHISNLSTSMCGWTSALTLMYLTEHNENIRYIPVLYQNSGDIPLYGEKMRVVGYQSVLITQKKADPIPEFDFSEKEKKNLLQIARARILENLQISDIPVKSSKDLSPGIKQSGGVFVSIYYKDELRGCIGRIESSDPIYKTVAEMAYSSAFNDKRFKSVTKEEMPDVHIEISLLSPLKKVNSIEEIIPGKHGILIRKDFRSGTYLPQVAIKTGWDAKQMVEHCAIDKAGMSNDEWKDADIYTYEALIIKD